MMRAGVNGNAFRGAKYCIIIGNNMQELLQFVYVNFDAYAAL